MEKTYTHLADITMDEDYEWGNAPRYAIKPGFDIFDLYGTELIALIESYQRLVNSEILKRNKTNNENNDLLNRIAKLEEELKREQEKTYALRERRDELIKQCDEEYDKHKALEEELKIAKLTYNDLHMMLAQRDECNDRLHKKNDELKKKLNALYGLPKNLDCPRYAARAKAKYDSLIEAGFTEDQAMAQMPLWTDN